MKKIISIILVLILSCQAFGTLSVFASDSNLIYHIGFDSAVTNDVPVGSLTISGSSARVIEGQNSNKSLLIGLGGGAGGISIPVNATDKKLWYHIKVKVNGKISSGEIFQLRDASSNATTLFKKSGSNFTDINGKIARSGIATNKWVTLDAYVDYENKTYSVYVDGKTAVLNSFIKNAVNATTSLNFQFISEEQSASVEVDEIAIYNGKSRRVSFPKETYNPASSEYDEQALSQKINKIYMFENYNDKATFYGPQNYGGFPNIIVKENGEAYFEMSSVTTGNAYSTSWIDIPTSKNMVVDAKIKVEKVGANINIFTIYDAKPNLFNLLQIDTTMTMKAYDGTIISQFRENEWVRYSCAIDFNKGTYDVYINGKRLYEGIPILAAFSGDVKRVLVNVTKTINTGDSKIYIDDYAIYDGKEPLEKVDKFLTFTGDYSFTDSIDQAVTAAISDNTVTCIYNGSVYRNQKKYVSDSVGYDENGVTMFPLDSLAEAYNLKVSKNNNEITLNNNIKFTIGSKNVVKDNKTLNAPLKIVEDKDTVMVPLAFFVQNLMDEKIVEVNDVGISFINKTLPAPAVTNADLMGNVRRFLMYERMSGDEMLERVKTLHPNKSHPRISYSKETMDNVKKAYAEGDPFVKHTLDDLIHTAEGYIKAKPIEFGYSDGDRSLNNPETIQKRITALSYLYKYTNDKKYLDRAWEEIETVANYPTWSGNYLHNSYIALGFAFAYDWLYNDLTNEQKKIMAEAMYSKHLIEFARDYQGMSGYRTIPYLATTGNSNACVSGGTIMASLALIDEEEYSDICKFVLENASRNLEYSFDEFIINEGASSEGAGYFNLTTNYLTKGFDAILTCLGTDLGYSKSPYLIDAVDFKLSIFGPIGQNNYHDVSGNEGLIKTTRRKLISQTTGLSFFAKIYGPSIATAWKNMTVSSKTPILDPYDLVWYTPNDKGSGQEKLDSYVGGDLEMVTMRSSWEDDNAIYASFHGGLNYTSHSHIDGGTFILDAGGATWFEDLASESYGSGSNLSKQNSYRVRPEGHNVYLVNPREDSMSEGYLYTGQALKGVSEVVKYETSERGAFGVIDLSDCYREDVKSAQRGIRLLEDRKSFVLRDEMTLKRQSDILSFMHTMADIEITSPKTAILTRDGKRLFVELSSSDENAYFKVMDPVSLVSTVPVSPQYFDLSMFKKLTACVSGNGDVYINIKMTPLYEDNQVILKSDEPIESWKNEEGSLDIPVLKEIYENGNKVSNFNPENKNITITLKEGQTTPPVLSATADSRYEVKIKQSDDLFKEALITVTDKENKKLPTYYTVNFMPYVSLTDNVEGTQLNISSIFHNNTSSNVTATLTDKDFSTYHGSMGRQHEFIVDLGQVTDVSSVLIAFHNDSYKYYYNVAYSEDGINYYSKDNLLSQGITDKYEKVDIGKRKARYIKITGNGHLSNYHNQFSEIIVVNE